jgi:hypothetical protein
MTNLGEQPADGESPDPPGLPDPPPIPSLPATSPRREQTLRAFAERIVQKLGAPAALARAAELDERVAEQEDER